MLSLTVILLWFWVLVMLAPRVLLIAGEAQLNVDLDPVIDLKCRHLTHLRYTSRSVKAVLSELISLMDFLDSRAESSKKPASYRMSLKVYLQI
jgi:hypothetical protein